jgi:dUTP pyrophosphatase
MKAKIYIKYHNPNCKLESHGNWIDLKSAETVVMPKASHRLIDLGFSCQLPKYYQANIVPRSSTYNKFGLIQANHYGVVDGPDANGDGYSGNDDHWKFSAISLGTAKVDEGDRICQFEIKPTMFAPWYVKLKWLFTNDIEFIEVNDLKSENRGGHGSTGK